jgi:hypothetical protein
MSFILFVVCGLLAALIATAFYNHASLQRQWEFVLEPWHDEILSGFHAKAAGEQAAANSAYRRALKATNHAEAVRLIDVGLRFVERTAEDWMTILRYTALLSRMADAITPISPLGVWAFRLPALRGWALVNAILHHFVVTAGERLRLRCYVLRECWKVARRNARRSTRRITRGVDDWRRLAMVREDLATSTEETIRSFHAILLSISARQANEAVTASVRRG